MKIKKIFDRRTKDLAIKVEFTISEALWLKSLINRAVITQSIPNMLEQEVVILKDFNDQLNKELI